MLDKDEVKAAAGSRGKVIEIEDFVPDDQIDPVFYDKTYYVGPRDDDEAYRVFHEALKQTERVGIGRFTFHDRERVVAIRPSGGLLALSQLRLGEEVRPVDEYEVEAPRHAPGDREVEMAGRLVESLHEDWDPARYEDEHRAAVLELVERKARGEAIDVPEAPPQDAGDDLLAALEASLAGSR